MNDDRTQREPLYDSSRSLTGRVIESDIRRRSTQRCDGETTNEPKRRLCLLDSDDAETKADHAILADVHVGKAAQ